METYIVDVKSQRPPGKKDMKVEAESEDDARDRWNDGEYVDSNDFMGNEREVIHVEKF